MALAQTLERCSQARLERAHAVTQHDVANQKVKLIDQAVCKQAIEKNVAAIDQQVELTDEGLGTIRAAFEADMQLESRWLAALSGEERRELAGLLRKLGSAVPTFEKSDGGAGSSPVPIS